MLSTTNSAKTLITTQEVSSMAGLRRVVKPLEVNGMTLDQVFHSTALLLLERGDLQAMEMARELLGQHETVEYRTLLRLRQSLQDTVRRGNKRD